MILSAVLAMFVIVPAVVLALGVVRSVLPLVEPDSPPEETE